MKSWRQPRLLFSGTKEITLFGEEIQVNAEIYNLEGFSGHADRDALFAWAAAFRQKPKQIFLVHGEHDAKVSFAKLLEEKLGYNPVVVTGNSEFELDLDSAEILNMESAEKKEAEYEEIQDVRNKIAGIHEEIEHILYNADLAMGNNISEDKMIKINNLVQELAKATVNLGSAVTEEDR